jgi:ATP-binding cassette subfamily B protein
VDTETDEKIRTALKKDLCGSTVVLISHRVTTLMDCDSILVLEHGRIAEAGSHEELYDKNGIYRRICDMQMSLGEDESA